ncbi:NADH dehydrogenase,E; NADH dehydrogenase [uncultured bacterium]|nr:NADH dehydrogenase,E; NADH dehydrogenase [uncultured bacterium]
MILVTGGTGFVGNAVVRELLDSSHRVRVLARRPERAALQPGPSFQAASGDVTDISSILKAITPEIETVIHLVGILAESRGARFQAVHVDATRNVVEACKGMGVGRLLHMSALGAREGAASEYHRTKWEAEEIVRASGLGYTIFRPSVIFGPRDHFTNLFARMMRLSPVVMVPGSGRGLMQPVYVGDVAKAFALSLRKKETIGKTLELGGPEKLTFDEVIERIGEAAGLRRRKLHVPMPLMRANALLAEKLLSKPPFSRDALKMLEEENTTALNALVEVFGMTPRALSEGMREYLGAA